MKIPSDLLSQYPETIPQQCIHWRSCCAACGTRYTQVETVCSDCGAPRERCKNKCMRDEDSCRVHIRARTYNVYTVLSQHMADDALEAMIERDDRDLAQEYQLARMVIANMVDPVEQAISGKKFRPDKLLEMLKTFFEIAEKRKKIEEGDQLNIRIDDEAKRHIRGRMKALIGAFQQALQEHLPDQESLHCRILARVRELSHLPGNEKTIVPMHNGKKIPMSSTPRHPKGSSNSPNSSSLQ